MNEIPVPFYRTRLFRWLLGVLALVLFIGFGFVRLTEYVAGNALVSQVESHTDGAYTITFEKLRIDWFKTKIKLQNFDYKRTSKPSDVKHDFVFKANNAVIQLENLRGIYLEKALHVEKIQVESPVLQLDQFEKPHKKSSFSIKTGDLYKVVQGFVKSFQIDDFEVNHLHFDYFQNYDSLHNHYFVNDLSFSILNFHLDSNAVASDSEFFFTESLKLSIKDQDFNLGDGIHKIHFDSLLLSTKTNNIELFNFSILKLDSANVKLDSGSFNQYNVHIPYTGIKGLDFSKAYTENILHVDSIVLDDAEIYSQIASLKRNRNKVQIDTTVQNRLVKVILGVFEELELNHFAINNARLEADYGSVDTAKIEGLNLYFDHYKMDSSSLLLDSYYPYFDGMRLQINQPDFDLPNGMHLRASVLNFSTYDSALVIENVKLSKGIRGEKKDAEILVAQVRVEGVKPHEIIKKSQINLNKLIILNPHLQIITDDNRKGNKAFDLSALLDGAIKQYQIKHVIIDKGNANLITSKNRQSPHQIREFKIELFDFKINESELKKGRFLFSKSAKMKFDDVRIFLEKNQHYIQAGSLNLNSRNGLVHARQLSMYPSVTDSSKIKMSINLKAAEFKTTGIDFKNIQHLKTVNLRELSLQNVEAFVNHFRVDSTLANNAVDSTEIEVVNSLFGLESLDVHDVNIADLNLVYQRKGESVVKFSKAYFLANHVSATPDTLNPKEIVLVTDSLRYGMDRLMAPIIERNHMLSIQSIRREKDSLIQFNGVSIRPIFGKVISDSALKMTSFVSEVKISGFHTLERGVSDSLKIGYINVTKPMLRLRLPLTKKDSNKTFKLLPYLTEDVFNGVFSSIKLDGFEIREGNIEVKKENFKFTVRKLNLDTRELNVSKTTKWEKDRFLYAKGFNISMKEMEYEIPGFKICHHLDSLNYRFNPNALQIYGVYFNNLKSGEDHKGTEMSIYLPQINIINPDIYQYLTDSNIVVDRIESSNGMVEADFYGDKTKDSTQKMMVIPSQIPVDLKGFEQLAIHELEVNKMDFQMRIHKGDVVSPLEMNHFNLKVDSFHVAPGEQIDSNRLLWADNIEMSMKNIYTTVDEGLYEIGADEFRFSTQRDTIGVSGLSFIPTVPRYEYALHKGHRKDVFNLSLRQLGVSGLNYFDLVYDQSVKGRVINLDQPSLSILKDKRIPEPPYKRKEILPEMFKRIPVSITFDSVLVDQMKIRYEEFPEHGRNPGNIMLNHMDIKVTNLTNDTGALRQDSTMRIYMTSKLLDTADLSLYLEYNMISPDNSFKMSTELGSFDGTLINRYIEPTVGAKINSLEVDRMEMSVIGNDSIAGGRMGFYYDNLNFNFLNQETQESKGFGNRVRSMVGNVVVKSKNKYHPFKRRAPIYFERITGKGWINYLVKIELVGLGSSAGYKTKSYKKQLNQKATKDVWKKFDKEYKATRKEKAKAQKKADKIAKKKSKAKMS